jgi:hypothetical protein
MSKILEEGTFCKILFCRSESENGTKTQIWATWIAHWLRTVLKRLSNKNNAGF